jgi:DHA2 family multidrug resistance protein
MHAPHGFAAHAEHRHRSFCRGDVPYGGLTNQAGFVELFFPQVLRGIALMLCYLPANMIALGKRAARQVEEGRGAL